MIWDSQRDELLRFPNRVFAAFPYIRNNLRFTILIQTHTDVPHLAYRPTVDRTGLLTQYDKCDNAALAVQSLSMYGELNDSDL